MDNLFKDFFRRYHFLRPADLVELYKLSSWKSYPAGELIARNGDFFQYIIAIRKGIIRTYVLTPQGEEKTVRFAKEGEFTGCSESFAGENPSTEYLEVVEDCKVILFDVHRLKRVAQHNIRLLRLLHEGTTEVLIEAVRRIEFFTTLNPEERYRFLLASNPELLHRVPQKYLASYIGVTTVSLSRIRSRVAQNPPSARGN
jgi:CRP-like cAMP-binding protein